MDEAGVVKQTTIEQMIQSHQLSRTQSTEGIPMGEPFSPKKNGSPYNIPARNFPSFNGKCFGIGC
jgi:hypothetical protein